MIDEPTTVHDDVAATYLLQEYASLLKLRQDYIALGDNRFNFFLLILSGTAVFITWLNSSEPMNVSPEGVVYITFFLESVCYCLA